MVFPSASEFLLQKQILWLLFLRGGRTPPTTSGSDPPRTIALAEQQEHHLIHKTTSACQSVTTYLAEAKLEAVERKSSPMTSRISQGSGPWSGLLFSIFSFTFVLNIFHFSSFLVTQSLSWLSTGPILEFSHIKGLNVLISSKLNVIIQALIGHRNTGLTLVLSCGRGKGII